MGLFVMMNNLFHDFAVALLAAGFLMMWIVSRRAIGVPDRSLRLIYSKLSRFLVGCWVVILIGGAIRTWAYREYEWQPAAGRGQVLALAVKHVILFGIILPGLWVQWKLHKRLRR